MSRLTVGSIEGLVENSNVVSVPTGHSLNVADAGALQIGGSGVGLVFISRTTIGTAVSSVTVSDCFSSTYDNYRIVSNVGPTSGNEWIHVKIGTATTGYYTALTGGLGYNITYGANVIAYGYQNQSSGQYLLGGSYTTTMGAVLEVQSPFLATQTKIQALLTNSYTPRLAGLFLDDTDSHTSITLESAGGTITGGTIDVYGYIT